MHKPFFSAALGCTLALLLAACSSGGGHNDAGGDGGDATTGACGDASDPVVFTETGQYTRELYVDRNGDDGNDGSQAHPWQTLGRAGQSPAPGDRIHINAGTYFECLRLDNVRGTADHPIAFVAEGEVRVHCSAGEAVSGSGLSYVSFERVIVLASADNAIHVDGPSDHIVFRSVEVEGVGPGGDCIKVNQTDDVWVLDNDLHNADNSMGSSQGLDLVAVHRALVRGNHVHDIANSQGMFAKGGSSDVVFERNLIERITSDQADAIGIVLGGVTDRPVFIPIDADYEGTRLIARNNVVIGADGAGIGAQGCHGCAILNNTLWNTGHHGYAVQLSQGATGASAQGSGVSVNVDVRVMNNMVGNPEGTMRAPIQAEVGERQGLELSNNWWWNGPRDDVFDPGYNHDVGVDEPNSHLNEDPLVLDEDLPDLHLAGNSPARHAGRSLPEVTEDYEGRCRPAMPDIGAYQTP